VFASDRHRHRESFVCFHIVRALTMCGSPAIGIQSAIIMCGTTVTGRGRHIGTLGGSHRAMSVGSSTTDTGTAIATGGIAITTDGIAIATGVAIAIVATNTGALQRARQTVWPPLSGLLRGNDGGTETPNLRASFA